MELWEACPQVVGACWGAAEPVEPSLVEQEVGAPCQEEQEVAWASEAYLWDMNSVLNYVLSRTKTFSEVIYKTKKEKL